MLNVINEFTRHTLPIEVDRSTDADGVVAVVDRLQHPTDPPPPSANSHLTKSPCSGPRPTNPKPHSDWTTKRVLTAAQRLENRELKRANEILSSASTTSIPWDQ